ncbi:MAG TPA: hypothetical protein VF411_13305 [Bacteroidia bacterium]
MSKTNMPTIKVIIETTHLNPTDLIKAAKKVKTTGDAVAGGAPVTDAVMLAAINSLQTKYDGTQTKPPTVLEKDVNIAFNKLATMYKKNGRYLETVVNDEAIAEGDVSAGTVVVIRCGYALKAEAAKTPKTFKGDSKIEGEIDVTTKGAGQGATYIRQYGKTLVKHTPPTAAELAQRELLIGHHIKQSLINLKSGDMYAFREASIVPPHKKKTGTTTGASILTPAATQRATSTATTGGHTDVFSEGATSHYSWTGWIYVTVK